jgi:hypothetical protein
VNEYLDRINAAQAPVSQRSRAINASFRSFSTAVNTPKEVRALQRSAAELRRALRDVRRVHPPAEAQRLHADVVRLLAAQTAIAAELVWTARFAPQLNRALQPLRAAGAQVAADLHGKKRWAAQAAAFERYRGSLGAVLAQLEQLRAPSVLRPGLVGEQSILRQSVALSASVAAALRKHDRKAAAAGIRSLFGLSIGASAVRMRRDQIAAARAYNARLSVLSQLAAKIARERQRLSTTLG